GTRRLHAARTGSATRRFPHLRRLYRARLHPAHHHRLILETLMAAPTIIAEETADAAPLADRVVDAARWSGITRPYTAADVERLRPSIKIEHTLAEVAARRLWTPL